MTSKDPDDTSVVFRVAEDEAGERIDKLVARHAGLSGRRSIAELFRSGAVCVGGRTAKKGASARANDEVSVRLSPAIEPEPGAPLDVRLETADVVVVSKPAGQPTAPAREGEGGTLAAALVGRYAEMSGVGYRAREPGLLHRLDTHTSGLLVAARSAGAFDTLRRALVEGHIEKRYLAVVRAEGLAHSGTIDAPLAPDENDTRRVVLALPGARPRPPRATRWRTLRVAPPWALIEVDVRHAYRHQVRVHLASIGHPLASDTFYGGPRVPSLGDRHALHASYVAWAGDDVVPGFEVGCALPADLAELVGPT